LILFKVSIVSMEVYLLLSYYLTLAF
jgi:hypothetical protein